MFIYLFYIVAVKATLDLSSTPPWYIFVLYKVNRTHTILYMYMCQYTEARTQTHTHSHLHIRSNLHKHLNIYRLLVITLKYK